MGDTLAPNYSRGEKPNYGYAAPHKLDFDKASFGTIAPLCPLYHERKTRLEAGKRRPFFLSNHTGEFMFSQKSKSNLMSCHPELQRLFHEVVKTWDCTVLEGHRNQKRQDDAFATGLSKLRFPASKHNRFPAHAVDVIPYPIDFADLDRIYNFGIFVIETAKRLGIKIRWGGDWDMDGDFKDQKFNDLVHFELV